MRRKTAETTVLIGAIAIFFALCDRFFAAAPIVRRRGRGGQEVSCKPETISAPTPAAAPRLSIPDLVQEGLLRRR